MGIAPLCSSSSLCKPENNYRYFNKAKDHEDRRSQTREDSLSTIIRDMPEMMDVSHFYVGPISIVNLILLLCGVRLVFKTYFNPYPYRYVFILITNIFLLLTNHQSVRVSSLLVCGWLLQTLCGRGNIPIPKIKGGSNLENTSLIAIKPLEHLVVMDKRRSQNLDTATTMEIGDA